MKSCAVAVASASVLWGGAAIAQEVTLRAISAQPQQLIMVARFLDFVHLVNERGEGVVQIQYIGGPEVTPPPQQAIAVRQGVVDLQIGPAGYYLGTVPEADALAGSNVTPMAARAAGGVDLLNEIWRDRMNARVLGHFGGGIGFNIYLRNEPAADSETGIDVGGARLRSSPPYTSLFESIDAVNVVMPVGEVYTALERGLVEGLAFPSVGVTDFGWERFLNYRVNPTFWQEDSLLVMNLDSWEGLSQEAQTILQDAAIEWEQSNYDFFTQETIREQRMLEELGLEVIELEGDRLAAFLANAYAQPWNRLQASAPESYERLRAVYFNE